MLCEEVLGTLSDEKFSGRRVDYVDIEWHEAFHACTGRLQQRVKILVSVWEMMY